MGITRCWRGPLVAGPVLDWLYLGFRKPQTATLVLGGRPTVGHVALDHGIGVRIPASQPVATPFESCRVSWPGRFFTSQWSGRSSENARFSTHSSFGWAIAKMREAPIQREHAGGRLCRARRAARIRPKQRFTAVAGRQATSSRKAPRSWPTALPWRRDT